MTSEVKDLSNISLEELEKLKEHIDDRIEIIKGRESLKNHSGYSSTQVNKILKECLRE